MYNLLSFDATKLPQSRYRICPSLPKMSLHLSAVDSFLSASNLRQPLIYSAVTTITLYFLGFRVNEIRLCPAFVVWLCSLSIMILRFIHTFAPSSWLVFITELCFVVWMHHFAFIHFPGGCIVSGLWLLFLLYL